MTRSVGKQQLLFRAFSLLGLLFFVAVAIFLIAALFVMIDVIREGIMHKMTTFESEPKEGWDYWRWKYIKEAIPSWIIAGVIWLSLFATALYASFRSGKYTLKGR